jgi:uncharacterized membrane protein (DUF373 family)
MWLRWTLPRPRIDQVLYACVKVLLPLSCVLLLGSALWQLFVPDIAGIPWADYDPLRWSAWAAHSAGLSLVVQLILMLIGLALVVLIVGWVLYAAASGRRIKQRLTEPAEIVIARPQTN